MYNRIIHFTATFKYEGVYSICFLPNYPKILVNLQSPIRYILIYIFFILRAYIFHEISSSDPNLWKIEVCLTFVILLGNNSSSGFDGIPINNAWIDDSTITVSYIDSTNTQFCCPWKRGALISDAFLKNHL